MPLHAFLQAVTSYHDPRRSSYDTRRLGGSLVSFPPAPPGALLHSIFRKAAASSVALSPSGSRFPALGNSANRHSAARHLALGIGIRLSAPRHSAARQLGTRYPATRQLGSPPSRRYAGPPAATTSPLAPCFPPCAFPHPSPSECVGIGATFSPPPPRVLPPPSPCHRSPQVGALASLPHTPAQHDNLPCLRSHLTGAVDHRNIATYAATAQPAPAPPSRHRHHQFSTSPSRHPGHRRPHRPCVDAAIAQPQSAATIRVTLRRRIAIACNPGLHGIHSRRLPEPPPLCAPALKLCRRASALAALTLTPVLPLPFPGAF